MLNPFRTRFAAYFATSRFATSRPKYPKSVKILSTQPLQDLSDAVPGRNKSCCNWPGHQPRLKSYVFAAVVTFRRMDANGYVTNAFFLLSVSHPKYPKSGKSCQHSPHKTCLKKGHSGIFRFIIGLASSLGQRVTSAAVTPLRRRT